MIEAIINVSRETQKGIIIGHQGNKQVGTEARLRNFSRLFTKHPS